MAIVRRITTSRAGVTTHTAVAVARKGRAVGVGIASVSFRRRAR